MDENWSGASTVPAKTKKMEQAWAHSEKQWRQHCETSITVGTAELWKEAAKERSDERKTNVDNGL